MADHRRTSRSRSRDASKEKDRSKESFVYVRRLIEKKIKVPVLSTDKVKTLKEKIEHLEGINTANQALDFGGIPLHDENATLAQYGIKSEDHLHVIEKDCIRGWIQLFIKGPKETFPIGICAQSTVLNLKKKIEEKTGLEMDKQRLVFQGELLPNSLVLASSEVKQSSTVQLYPARLTKIIVRSLTGASHTIEVEDVDTVFVLKQKIFKVFHIPPSAQNLIGIGDKQLDDKKMMMDYDVKENSIVWIIPNNEEVGEQITVFVVNSKKKKFSVETRNHISVLAFKKKIEAIEGTPEDRQKLFVGDEEVSDHLCMTDADIVDGTTVDLHTRVPLTLRVGRGHGIKKGHQLVVDANDKVSVLKRLITGNSYMTENRTNLFYLGTRLDESSTIASYDIPNNAMINVKYEINEC